jgi:hypothetical protein
LINHDTAEKCCNEDDGHLGHPKMTVQTQQDGSTSDHYELQGPCMVPEGINSPADQRVDLRATTFQNHDGEKGIENIQPCNQKKAAKQHLAVAINVPAPLPIPPAPKRMPSTGQGIPAQNGGGLISSILKSSIVHLRKRPKIEF